MWRWIVRLCILLQRPWVSVCSHPAGPAFCPLDETHPVAPQDIYGTTKWLGEELVESMVRLRAFRAVSLRMPWIQTPESFYHDIGERRRTAAAAADLWAYLDARDAGRRSPRLWAGKAKGICAAILPLTTHIQSARAVNWFRKHLATSRICASKLRNMRV